MTRRTFKIIGDATDVAVDILDDSIDGRSGDKKSENDCEDIDDDEIDDNVNDNDNDDDDSDNEGLNTDTESDNKKKDRNDDDNLCNGNGELNSDSRGWTQISDFKDDVNHKIDDDGDEGDEEEDDDDHNSEEESGIPVDKGRAWLVMMSCFLMHILVVGGGKSFGVFVQEFQDRFQVGTKELGLINGMALMLMLGLAIFVNMLAVKFSARRVVTAGSLLTSAGFIMTAFVPSFNWLYVTYGVITGLGLALSFSPTIVMMGQCFKKYRSVALGFALSGSGIGSFGFPALARILINTYNLQGCLLIIGGLMLNVAICGLILPSNTANSKSHKKKKKNLSYKKSEKINGETCENRCEYDDINGSKMEKRILIDNNDVERKYNKGVQKNTDQKYYDSKVIDENNMVESIIYKTLEQDGLIQKKIIGNDFLSDNIKIEVIDNVNVEIEIEISPPISHKEILRKLIHSPAEISLSSGHIPTRENSSSLNTNNTTMKYNNGAANLHTAKDHQMSKSANFLHVQHAHRSDDKNNIVSPFHLPGEDNKSLSTSHLPDPLKSKALLTIQNNIMNHKISQNRISSSLAYVSNCNLAMASQGNLDRLSIVTSRSNKCLSSEGQGQGRKQNKGDKPALFEWSLLRDLPFIMHFFEAYLGYFCYISNFFMLANYASMCGLDRDTAAWTLSIVGITELVARLTFPPITEILCCRRRRAWSMALVVMGVFNFAVPYMKTLTTLMTYAALFGYACGCFTTLIPVLCAEIKGPDKMGSSFGLTTMAMGLAVMTGPSLCGTIKDLTGYWDYGFVTLGCFAFIGSFLGFVEPWVEDRWNR